MFFAIPSGCLTGTVCPASHSSLTTWRTSLLQGRSWMPLTCQDLAECGASCKKQRPLPSCSSHIFTQ
eukprot:2361315-Pyramimonas_sp.AAC.1